MKNTLKKEQVIEAIKGIFDTDETLIEVWIQKEVIWIIGENLNYVLLSEEERFNRLKNHIIKNINYWTPSFFNTFIKIDKEFYLHLKKNNPKEINNIILKATESICDVDLYIKEIINSDLYSSSFLLEKDFILNIDNKKYYLIQLTRRF
jgi:hypothetical protein